MIDSGLDVFTTTLSISPHKSAEVINTIGQETGKDKFLARNFKKKEGFKIAIQMAKKWRLYRQNYCGCVYSLKERRKRKMSGWPSREKAQKILEEWVNNKNLRKHAYAVESAMRSYAQRFGEDPEKWGIVGLLHDFDYEKYPNLKDHPFKGINYLRERGYSEELISGILAHAEHTNEPRDTNLKKAIFAVDELTGLIVAVALVRPSKKVADVKVKSVKKKWKDKSFAQGVNREMIEKGASELGIPLDEHIQIVLKAMQGVSEKLGL